MKKEKRGNYSDFLAGLLVFGIFAAGMIATLLAGAGAYKRLTAGDAEAYNMRVTTQYVATKLRGAQSLDGVDVAEVPEIDGTALVMREEIDGEGYLTYVYCMDGWLREIFASENYAPDFKTGEKLIELSGMDFEKEDGLIAVSFTTGDGENGRLFLSLETGEVK